MLWNNQNESSNVEDRRGVGGYAVGGGIGAVVIGLIYMFLGGNPQDLQQALPQRTEQQGEYKESASEAETRKEVSRVLGSTEDVWTELLAAQGVQYTKPVLTLFTGQVESGCGSASAATGPFYCPADRHVFLDMSFFQEMDDKLHAPGDFAQAYVIAHEVGHHVQNLLGISRKLDEARGNMSQTEYNKLSVKLELQADFLAGVWANHAQQKTLKLESGDVEEAINAASAVGDDRLQQESQGRVVPDAFTHGTSAQRMYWFKKGLTTGDIRQGNTFEAADL